MKSLLFFFTKQRYESFITSFWILYIQEGILCGVVPNVQECDMFVNVFEHQSHYYIHFQTKSLWESYKNSYLWVK